MERKDEKKKEIRTYRNDEEKEWNNITNDQIIPEKIQMIIKTKNELFKIYLIKYQRYNNIKLVIKYYLKIFIFFILLC